MLFNFGWLRKNEAKKMVAVVVPLSNRVGLTPDEQISMRHLTHYLSKYDKYFVAPKNLQVSHPDFSIKRFNEKYFGSIKAHRDLMLSEKFYRSFIDYKYILIYHLDALVFSDQLEEWCNSDFDFIGSPWIKHKDAPYSGDPAYEGKVGNSGFSLKKIESFLGVLNSQKYFMEPKSHWEKYYGNKASLNKFFYFPKKIIKYLKRFNNAKFEKNRYSNLSEELFWINRAQHYYPKFRIPDVKTALRFGFESVPRYCYEINNQRLPFGCHAWQRYDRDFWEPYLLR